MSSVGDLDLKLELVLRNTETSSGRRTDLMGEKSGPINVDGRVRFTGDL